MSAVPTLDLRRFETGDAADRSRFASALGRAFREFGFCGIEGHGIAAGLVADAYEGFRAFFALPEAAKMRCHRPGTGGARGFTPYKVETARDSQHPDLKEFFHVGRPAEDGPWPVEIGGLAAAARALYAALDALGARLLAALALDLGLAAEWFAPRVDRGNSILRAIHYPPLDPAADALPNLRAGAHEDINLITLLVGASAAGLELLTRDGRWLPVTAAGDSIVVNIGDMLQRLSNHVYPSTTHRVVNPRGAAATEPRYSLPFFLHPNPEVSLAVLPGCVSASRPNRYPQPITADAYLQQRLREIRLL